MDKESIRQELIQRVSSLPEMKKTIDKSDLTSFEATAESLMGTPAFAQKIKDTLNQILEEKGITFASDEERSALKQFLKSTNTDLLKKYMAQ